MGIINKFNDEWHTSETWIMQVEIKSKNGGNPRAST